MPEQVDWNTIPRGVGLNEKIAGSRHGAETTRTPAVQAWTCPACNAKNVSVFEHGCPACQAGAPGRHVGVDPIARKAPPAAGLDAGKRPSVPNGGDSGHLELAFQAWFRPMRDRYAPEVQALVFEAFKAGFWTARGQVAETAPTLTGTAESRTLIAALQLFVEERLPLLADEVAAGEFLNAEAIAVLIARLERTA